MELREVDLLHRDAQTHADRLREEDLVILRAKRQQDRTDRREDAAACQKALHELIELSLRT